MTLWEIVNPSDPYTFEAEDIAVGRFVVITLGMGQYEGEDKDGNIMGAMMLFMGEAETTAKLREFFGTEGLEVFVNKNRPAIIAALESVMSLPREERNAYDQAVKLMSPDKIDTYRRSVHDMNRSSLNDIGDRAWKYAAKLREGDDAPPSAPHQVFRRP